MATSQLAPPHLVPLQLCGNTSDQQNQKLLELLSEAVEQAHRTSIEQLDRQSAQTVIDTGLAIKSEIVQHVVDIILNHTVSDKYKDEQVPSDRVYPPTYRVRPIEAQVTELRRAFPMLATCNERLARKGLPEGAEAWFAIPRWQAVAPTYNEAVEMLLMALGSRRKFSNRIIGKLGPLHLRQSERSKLAEKILAEQQEGNDLLVVAAQAGMLHRGLSSRRTRIAMAGNEFALGVFAFGCMLLTHPERLSMGETLMVDCGGDEYSVRGDYNFDRVPLFDFELGGLEISIFYDDRARNLWGTPTGFLFKPV